MDVIRYVIVSALVILVVNPVEAKPYREPLSTRDRVRLQSAIDRRQIGDTIGAIRKLREFLKYNPYHPRATKLFYRLAEPRISDTQYLRSVKNYFKSDGREELFLAVFNGSSLGDTDRFQLLRWAVDRYPESAQLHLQWLKHARKMGGDTIIRNNRESLLKQFPHEADLFEFYASWLKERGQWEQASEYYRRLIGLRPGYHVGYQGLGEFYRRMDNQKKARDLEERATALRTGDSR